MTSTSIASKIANLNTPINGKKFWINILENQIVFLENQIKSKDVEIKNKEQQLKNQEEEKDDTNHGLRQLLTLEKERSALKDEVSALEKERSAVKDEVSALEKEVLKLENSFRGGTYFSHLSDYWKEEVVNIEQNGVYSRIRWTDYQRTREEAERIQVRQYNNNEYSVDYPYQVTRNGAIDSHTFVIQSKGARSSAGSQKIQALRDTVWPTDIFGNKAKNQPIAHLLPAGIQHHKEWMYVAAAVVGIGVDAEPEKLKKAVRGFKKQKDQSRIPGTGVVHFVSNKLRMTDQRLFLDGENPSALLIPVMTLSQAKSWNGQAYSALFVMGLPRSLVVPENDPMDFLGVFLSTKEVMYGNVIQDANEFEIEVARATLITAVLALRNMLSQLDQRRINGLNLDAVGRQGVSHAQQKARETNCILPQKVENVQNRKPLCLVKFGRINEEGKHPPPDPLLLAYKAANIWAKMTKGIRLLANGEEADIYDDMSEGDYLAEMAFLDARYGHFKPQSWKEFAVALGQPNGYQQ
jgi:hypothetical protein